MVLRPKISSVAFTSLSLTGPQGPHHIFPLLSIDLYPDPIPNGEGFSSWQLNPPARLASLHLVLNPISFNLLPIHGVVPIIQLHTRAGIRGYPTLLLLQRVSPTALSSLFVRLSMVCSVLSPHPRHESA